MLWLFVACISTSEKIQTTDVHITWLGVTSFFVSYEDKTILLDAFFSRPKLGENEGSSEQGKADFLDVMQQQGIEKLDAILIGHSHYDHAIDVGMVALETGAPIYGSATTCWIAKAQGVAESQCVELGQGDEFSIGSMHVDVARTIHWWPEQGGIGGAYDVFTEAPDPDHLFIVPHGGVLSFLMTFTQQEGKPSVLFQNSLGPIDADDGSGEDYVENLSQLLQNKESPTLWMTCIDCANNQEEFLPYLQQIQPKNILSIHFDGLNPNMDEGLQESFQEPTWFPAILADIGATSIYPEAYYQRFLLKHDGVSIQE